MALMEINRNPTPRQLRQFAGVCIVFFGVGGLALLHKHGWPIAGWVIWAALDLIAMLGLLRPALIRPLFVGLSYATFPLGWVVSHVILIVTFFGVFTPISLLLRLTGRDPLHRRFDGNAKTYWKPRSEVADTQRYFRQY